MDDIQINLLTEQLKTVKNLCDISVLVMDVNRFDLLPTVLELLALETQDILDDQCVVDK